MYYGPETIGVYGWANESGYDNWDQNRVYREWGYYFTVYYANPSNQVSGYCGITGTTRWQDDGPTGGPYVRSVCMHSDHDSQEDVYPVTCQRYLAALAAAVALGIAAVAIASLSDGGEPATATPSSSLTALDGMSEAMSKPETALSSVPARVARQVAHTNGTAKSVRRLLASVGDAQTSFYMWPGGGESVCYTSTGAGGGGCFAKFIGPFNITIADRHLLGTGDSLQVSGPVRADVVGVEVVVDGKSHPALVRNQVAFFEAPDPSSLPDDVERVTVTLEDGTKEDVRL